MYDIAALAQQFQADGFVLVRNFLTEVELTNLDRQLHRYIRHVAVPVPQVTFAFRLIFFAYLSADDFLPAFLPAQTPS